MPRPQPSWQTLTPGEWFPVCPKPECNQRYGDGQILDVKNYPDDGMAVFFLECERCHTEAELTFVWSVLQPKTFTVVKPEEE